MSTETKTLNKLIKAYRSLGLIYQKSYQRADNTYSLALQMYNASLAYMRFETACLYPESRPKTKALLDLATESDLRRILDGMGSKIASFERTYSDEYLPDDEEIDHFLASRIGWFYSNVIELSK